MNIESSKINSSGSVSSNSAKTCSVSSSSVKFSDELDDLKKTESKKDSKESEKTEKEASKKSDGDSDSKTLDDAVKGLNSVLNELNLSDEKDGSKLKNNKNSADINNKGENLINNDFNIQDNKLPQMNPNMNFSGDGQPFSSFMNNGSGSGSGNDLSSSAKDLAEEAAILSTMAENIAMANKLNVENSEQTVQRNDGIKKIDTRTGMTRETVIKFDSVIMNEADVEVFANLVQNGEANINNLAPEAAQKSVQVSKTLADMLAKAMEDNKPLRIEFDNNISVIIRISRDGKLSADFLPSSQVAEAYLKENLPLLKQRFDEQNIDYDELNQRERREQSREQNKKKGQENE